MSVMREIVDGIESFFDMLRLPAESIGVLILGGCVVAGLLGLAQAPL